MTDIKKTKTNIPEPEEEKPIEPYVNEKLKYYLIAAVAVLCIITALVVVFSPEAKKQREKRTQSTVNITVLNT